MPSGKRNSTIETVFTAETLLILFTEGETESEEDALDMVLTVKEDWSCCLVNWSKAGNW